MFLFGDCWQLRGFPTRILTIWNLVDCTFEADVVLIFFRQGQKSPKAAHKWPIWEHNSLTLARLGLIRKEIGT